MSEPAEAAPFNWGLTKKKDANSEAPKKGAKEAPKKDGKKDGKEAPKKDAVRKAPTRKDDKKKDAKEAPKKDVKELDEVNLPSQHAHHTCHNMLITHPHSMLIKSVKMKMLIMHSS